MKNLNLLVCLMFLSIFSYSQIPYYDALELSKHVNRDGDLKRDTQVAKILDHYVKPDSAGTDWSEISDSLNNDKNPYIECASGGASTFKYGAGSKDIPSAISGLNVTSFAVGYSDFLIKRAKQELNVAFFRQFEKWLEDKPEAKTLFPKTVEYLDNIWAYEYSVMINTLKEAFIKDLEKLHVNFHDIFELPKYQNLVNQNPEILIASQSLKVITKLEHTHYHPSQVIKELSEIDALSHINASDTMAFNYKNTLKLFTILSESIRSNKDDQAWVSSQIYWQNIAKDKETLTIFLGLVYQQIKNQRVQFVHSNDTITVADFLRNNTEDINRAKRLYSNLIDLTEDIHFAIKDVSVQLSNNQQLTHQNIYTYVKASIDLFDYTDDVYTFINPDQSLLHAPYISMARNANELYLNISAQQYGSAIMELVGILNDTRKKLISEKVGMDEEFLSKLLRYGTFMANIANAKDGAEVQAAIESAALPVGSSSMKKNSKCNVAIQSYIGGQLNLSYLLANNGFDGRTTWTGLGSLYAPLGISLTPGFFSCREWGSVSVFGSIIDVGAVVQYRLANPANNIELEENIQLGYILSPGYHLVYGSPGYLPLSIGVGRQYGPGLSEITKDGISVIDPKWRFNLFLAVDIPLISLYNREKTKLK